MLNNSRSWSTNARCARVQHYARPVFTIERIRRTCAAAITSATAEDYSGSFGATYLGLYWSPCEGQICGPVQEWLASQAASDIAGLADGRLGGARITTVHQVSGVVEQAVGEVVGGAQLAQAINSGGERRVRRRVTVAGGEADAHQVAFGPQHRGEMPEGAGIEEGEQLTCGGCIAEIESDAGRQRPHPPYELAARLGADVTPRPVQTARLTMSRMPTCNRIVPGGYDIPADDSSLARFLADAPGTKA